MNKDKLFSGILLSIIGLLFIVFKGEVISIIGTIIGVIFIINGIKYFSTDQTTEGITLIVIGILIIIFGWVFVAIALYLVGIILIVFGVYTLYVRLKSKLITDNVVAKVLYFMIPVLYILAGGCLFFNQGGTISFIFIVVGVIILLNGLGLLLEHFKYNK